MHKGEYSHFCVIISRNTIFVNKDIIFFSNITFQTTVKIFLSNDHVYRVGRILRCYRKDNCFYAERVSQKGEINVFHWYFLSKIIEFKSSANVCVLDDILTKTIPYNQLFRFIFFKIYD